MATPEKTKSIMFESTTLSDSKLPITTFDKATLITWLNSVSTTKVAIFFNSPGDISTDVRLVMGEYTGSAVNSGNQLESGVLPCPEYCK